MATRSPYSRPGTTRVDQETRQAIEAASNSYNRHPDGDREKRVRGGLDYVLDAIRGLLILAVLAFIVLLIDGGRRESEEFYANLAAFKPSVSVRRIEDKLTVAEKMQLEHKDMITTAKVGSATIAFPDGSAVIVQPSTKFEVQLLDYNRGPKRDRSFLLRSGSIFTRISKMFGKKGQTLICTPNAVAAARGTGFSVSFDPSSQTTFVEVIDGKVALRNAGGRIEIRKGQTGTAIGNHPPTLGVLGRPQALATLFTRLAQLDQPVPPIIQFERDALTMANPLLQILALTPHGFSPSDNDWARRAETKKALQLLQQALEAVNGEVPDELNPVSLTELGLNETERQKILNAFAGFSIDRYEKRGQNSYLVQVRSRDSAGSVYVLTETGVDQVN